MSTLLNVLRTPELRNKILFTIFILVLYRLGAQIPAPGVSLDALGALRDSTDDQGGVLAYLTAFTGSGGFLTFFGLGILPYITASIVIQILTVAVPKLEEWQSQGAVGQRKITQWTRYITVALTVVQVSGLILLVNRQQRELFPDRNIGKMVLAAFCVTVGTAVLMWMGEMITQKGIGNGMSVLIFASVVSTLPLLGRQILEVKGTTGAAWLAVSIVALVGLVVGIVFIEQGQRRIGINFPKRVVGRKEFAGNRTYIPLKVNQAGVIPVIFASSLLQLPSLISNLLPTNAVDGQTESGTLWGDTIRRFIEDRLFRPTDPGYIIVFGLLIIGFAYFYNAISFDPGRRADELRKSGGFVTGIRPGQPTERYLAKILNRITLPGSIFLAFIALIPSALLFKLLGSDESTLSLLGFSGVSILIAVGVSLELMKQINSQLMARNYDGFLR